MPVASQLNVTEVTIRSLTAQMLCIAALGDFFKSCLHAASEPESRPGTLFYSEVEPSILAF
jgi:hypothetical protein